MNSRSGRFQRKVLAIAQSRRRGTDIFAFFAEGDVIGRDLGIRLQQDAPLDDVLEFPDVARPIVLINFSRASSAAR